MLQPSLEYLEPATLWTLLVASMDVTATRPSSSILLQGGDDPMFVFRVECSWRVKLRAEDARTPASSNSSTKPLRSLGRERFDGQP